MNKGMELSINLLIVLVIALVVIVAASVLVYDTKEGTDNVDCRTDFQNACSSFVLSGGCSDPDIDIRDHVIPELMRCGAGSESPDTAKRACCLQ